MDDYLLILGNFKVTDTCRRTLPSCQLYTESSWIRANKCVCVCVKKNVKQVGKNFIDEVDVCVPSLKFTYFLRPEACRSSPQLEVRSQRKFSCSILSSKLYQIYICIRVKRRWNYHRTVKCVSWVNRALNLWRPLHFVHRPRQIFPSLNHGP